MQLRNGVQTSEFWVTLLPTVVAGLVITGVISESDTNYIVEMAKDIVAGIVALASIITYIVSRSNLKREIVRLSAPQSMPTQIVEQKTTEVLVG